MSIMGRMGKIIKPLVNFPRWMGFRQILDNGRNIVKTIQDLKIRRPAVRDESFAQAMLRLNLNESDLQERKRFCFYQAIIYFILALIFFIYTIYLILHFSLGVILSFLLALLMTTFAYREFFWYVQIRKKKLGCTFREVLAFLFRRR